MARALFGLFGDTQQESLPPFSHIGQNGKSIRFEENTETNAWVVRDMLARGATRVFHKGDGVEHQNPNSAELQALAFILGIPLAAGVPIDVVAGNHDGSAFDVSGSAFKPLSLMVTSGLLRVFHAVSYDPALRALFIPYLHNFNHQEIRDAIRAALRLAIPDDYDRGKHLDSGKAFGVAHYGLKGAKAGARNLILPGDYLSVDELEICAGMDVCFAGHIHKAQQVQLGNIRGYHAGSTVIQDMGERLDDKTYLLFDPVTREVEIVPIPQKHRWVVADWPALPTEWNSGDIVQFRGEFEKGTKPDRVVEEMIAAGAGRPFVYSTKELRPKRADHVARDFAIDTTKGPHAAALEFADRKVPGWKDDPIKSAGVAAAVAAIRDAAIPQYVTYIEPDEIEGSNILTFKNFRYRYSEGLFGITGENGHGKTNFGNTMTILLWGKTAKNTANWTLVRQGEKLGYLQGTFNGIDPQGQPVRYRIRREFTLTYATPDKVSKFGQELKIEQWVDGKWDAKTLSDGGISQRQQTIDNIFGGGFLSARNTNFQFQKMNSARAFPTFVEAEPKDRKQVVGEACGHESVTRASKRTDTIWKALEKELRDASSVFAGMQAVAESVAGRADALTEEVATQRLEAEAMRGLVAPTEDAKTHAEGFVTLVEGQHRAIIDEINALENTGAVLAGAEAARKAATESYDKARAGKVTDYRGLETQIAAVDKDLADLNTPTEADVKIAETGLAEEEAEVERLTSINQEAAERLAAARPELERLKKDRKALEGKDLKECPSCKHEMDASHAEAEILRLDGEIVTAQAAVDKAGGDASTARTNLEEAKKTRGAAQQALQMAREDFARPAALRTRRDSLAQQLEAVKTSGEKLTADHNAADPLAVEKIAEAQKEHDAQQEIRARLTTTMEGYNDSLRNLRGAAQTAALAAQEARQKAETAERVVVSTEGEIARLREQEAALEKQREEIADLEQRTQVAAVAAHLLNTKDGLPVALIDDQLLFLEDRINHYFGQMRGENLSVELATRIGEPGEEEETLEILIDNGRAGPRLDANCFSGGQLDRIQIAIMLSMAELKAISRGVKFGYLGIDEPTGGLNSDGKAALIALLFDACSTFKIISVISHDLELRQAITRRVNVLAVEDQESVLQVAA